MTTKFPTPNLDLTLAMVSLPPDLSYEGEEIMKAVQADIALAVEDALTTERAARFSPFGNGNEPIELSPVEEKIRSFMHSTCRPLPEILPEIIRIAREYRDNGITWEQTAKNWEAAWKDARVTVPDGVEIIIGQLCDVALLALPGDQVSAKVEMVRAWLESLTTKEAPAPVETFEEKKFRQYAEAQDLGDMPVGGFNLPPGAPVEKRCGTCAHYSPGEDEYSGRCEADFPASATDQCPMEPEQGTKCPCWKAKS